MKMILVLTVICVVAALLLGAAYSLTTDKIEKQKEEMIKDSLKAVLPSADSFSDKVKGRTMEYFKGLDKNGSVIGYAFLGEGKGYSSVISIMIGVDIYGKIQGIKILNQNETPGLGTRIEEVKGTRTVWDLIKGKKIERSNIPWFQKQFSEKPIGEVQVITGATITSKAVINTVMDTVEKFKNEEGVS